MAQPPGFETSAPVHELIATRWSPRNFDPSAKVTSQELRSILEAARWAPSWGGTAPAYFIAGLRGSKTHSVLAELLVRGNSYATHAGALILGVAAESNEKGELSHAVFDLGWATGQLAVQAVALGLVTHPMAGFDAEAAQINFSVPSGHRPWIMVAVGHVAPTPQHAAHENLIGDNGPDALDPREPDLVARVQERDRRPRSRPPFDEKIFGGTWGSPLH